MKYIVAYAKDGYVYYMDNKLYDHKKQAFTRLKKLSENKSGLNVYQMKTFNLEPVEE
jgi:hypothetical protein